jgi:hypothetical protein
MVAALRTLTEMKMTVGRIRSVAWTMTDRSTGFDDVIYPVDYQVAGHIVDDEMHDIM